ncbi:unnamed protein product [Paramecium pentaurelia]|uniref:non-specific serine/threonine protein kinase n=1 Tax=Paramecium pentaurelia TaxID=43138 RepID=A0A8S1Y8H6_9CILI|nr:unnamed protein product [Paramecium pentaurelia]
MGNICDFMKTEKKEFQSSLNQQTVLQPIQEQELAIKSSKTLDNSTSFMPEQNQKRVGLEDFIMLATVGKGAFGKVYKVKKKDNQKIYAIKCINKKLIFDSKLESNALLEKNVLKQSKHPFIVQLKYSFQTPTKLYLVMEYINGGEFFKILMKTKGLPESIVAFVAAEVVLALEYLNYQLKVIYRDLKPENILLTTTGHVKLTDFGLATLRKDENVKNYTLAGTPEYLAPEIINKKGHSFEVDLWTLGILIYEMINGYPPFTVQDRNTQKILQLILQNKPNYPSIMSDEAKNLVQSLLKDNPKERIGAQIGYQEIKYHPFFANIKWSELYNLNIKSPLKTFAETNASRSEGLRMPNIQIQETPNPPQPNLQGISYAGGDDTYNSKRLN